MPARVSFIGPFVLLAALSLAAQPKPPNWPRFRGPDAAGIADGEHRPTRWDGTSGANIRWKVPIAGLAHSSPIGIVDAYNVRTGSKVYRERIPHHASGFRASPAIVDRTMYVRGQHHLFAIANTPQ
jgi:hypothetical protein